MSNQSRVNEIIAAMPSFSKQKYHKAEVLPELLELQKELVSLTFNGDHAENAQLRIWDVETHLQKLNEDRGYVADELLQRFMNGCKIVCNTIKSEMSGNAGEYKAFRSIETVQCRKSVMKNIEFTQDDRRTELDGIILTEKAIYIIEVKNPAKDIYIDERGNYFRVGTTMVFDKNIGEKMNDKTYLLRHTLATAGIDNPNIMNLIVFTNNSIHVENRYPYINTCFLADLPHVIERNEGTSLYTSDDIARMVESIEAAKCHESYPLPLDINEFKTNFAILMAALEEATDEPFESATTVEPTSGSTATTNDEKEAACDLVHANALDHKIKMGMRVAAWALVPVVALIGISKFVRK